MILCSGIVKKLGIGTVPRISTQSEARSQPCEPTPNCVEIRGAVPIPYFLQPTVDTTVPFVIFFDFRTKAESSM